MGTEFSLLPTIWRRKFLFFATLLLIWRPSCSWGLNGADIAIYNDTAYPGGGAWAEGLEAIETMLSSYGYTYEEITPLQINTTTNLSSLYRVIIFGGGWAGGYNQQVNKSGFSNIRNFVRKGGGYFGICAGAYFAADAVLWKPDQTPAELYNYPLDLFRGLARGVLLRIKPWTSPTGCQSVIAEGAAMTTIKVDNSVFPSVNSEIAMLYYGGPVLLPFANANQYVRVMATYKVPGAPADGQPAMILFPYGNGKVFLSGPHPEVSFDANSCSLYFDYQTWHLMNEVVSLLMAD